MSCSFVRSMKRFNTVTRRKYLNLSRFAVVNEIINGLIQKNKKWPFSPEWVRSAFLKNCVYT